MNPNGSGQPGTEGAIVVSRFERTQYFERLVELHLAYAMGGIDDRVVAMTIDEAIEWAEAELAATTVAEPSGDTPD